MNSNVEYYRPFGQQATGTVTFNAVPVTDATVTIGGVAFIFNDDFASAANFTGSNAALCARSLCECINSTPIKYLKTHNNLNGFRTFFAMYYGNVVVVVATEPGTGGNVIGVVVSGDTNGAIAVSGAVLAGGTSLAVPVVMSAGATAFSIETGTFTASGVAKVFSATSKLYSKLHILSTAGNVDATLGDSVAQPLPIVAGVWYTFDPPPLGVGDMNDLYVNGTNAEVFSWLRWY